MQFVKRYEKDTGLDLGGAITLFIVFLVSLLLLAYVTSFYDLKETIFGASITKHVSDIMTEHEAGKSIFLLSFVVLVLGLIKSTQIKEGVNQFFENRIVIPTTNFLIGLISVMLAVSTSVSVSLVATYGVTDQVIMILFYAYLKNILLSLFLLYPLIILNFNSSGTMTNSKKYILALVSVVMYIVTLSFYHEIDIF